MCAKQNDESQNKMKIHKINDGDCENKFPPTDACLRRAGAQEQAQKGSWPEPRLRQILVG